MVRIQNMRDCVLLVKFVFSFQKDHSGSYATQLKKKNPMKKMGRRLKETYLHRRHTDGQQT